MKIYQVGPDDAYDEPQNDERYLWLVYWYEIGDYCGDGEAVALGVDGKLYVYGLGHCSCYGPFDEWGVNRSDGIAVEDFLKERDSIHDLQFRDEVEEQVRKLLV